MHLSLIPSQPEAPARCHCPRTASQCLCPSQGTQSWYSVTAIETQRPCWGKLLTELSLSLPPYCCSVSILAQPWGRADPPCLLSCHGRPMVPQQSIPSAAAPRTPVTSPKHCPLQGWGQAMCQAALQHPCSWWLLSPRLSDSMFPSNPECSISNLLQRVL